MDAQLNQLLGKMPPIPNNDIEAYTSSKIVIFNARYVFASEGCFPSYEFMMPIYEVPPVKIDGKKLEVNCGEIFSINPEQPHCGTIEKEVRGFYSMFIDKEFVHDLSRLICGKSQVLFDNESSFLGNEIKSDIQLFIKESKIRQPGYRFILQSLETQMVVNLLRQLSNNLPTFVPEQAYNEKRGIKRVVEFLREHYNEDYSTEDAAKLANLSTYHFIRVFKAETGKTPYEFLLDIKIEKAREMLKLKNRTITEICFMSGFKNLCHFTTVFKKKTGMTPTDYRRVLFGEF